MKKNNFIFFWGGIYSQWYPSFFEIDGVTYNCCEQYMMAKKALMFGDYDMLKNIMTTSNPKDQKAFGRYVKNFNADKWNSVCRKIVFDGNYAKFTQNMDLLKQLLITDNKEIVEASPDDKIWGIGLSENDSRALDKSKWLGTN